MATVKFYVTPVYPFGNDHYYHEIIALAEGFEELGWEVIGNTNYWWMPEKGAYLIKGENENDSFDIAIYDYRYVRSFEHLLFRKGFPNFDRTKSHVLVDRNDWLQPCWWEVDFYEIFDLILSGNLYKNVRYPDNVKPWAIGLTNRIIKSIDSCFSPTQKRKKLVAYNFRVDHNMRGFLLNNLKNNLVSFPAVERLTTPAFNNESDAFYYNSTTKRHNPEYYKLLCEVQLFLSFGGYYDFKPFAYLPYSFINKILRKPYYWTYRYNKVRKRDFSKQIFIFQQDNFRFWEVLYSGCIAVNLDLDYWNFKLPVMPVDKQHYIGIKNLNSDLEADLVSMSDEELLAIGQNGRKWVYENYSPKAQALRVLSHLNG